MNETTPAPGDTYLELLDIEQEAPPPLLDRPVRVVAAERLPVETQTPRRGVFGRTHARIGEPTMIVGDHPARTLFISAGEVDQGGSLTWVFSHSAETCTPDSGVFGLPVNGITAHTPIWVYVYYAPGDVPGPADYWNISWYTEYTY